MKSPFDEHFNNFPKVEFDEEFYTHHGYGRLQYLTKDSRYEGIFLPSGYKLRNDPFLCAGYRALSPIKDVPTILKRQQVIREFADRISVSSEFKKIFSQLHFLNLWLNRSNWKKYDSKAERILGTYEDSVEKLVEEMSESGGILSELASLYKNRFPKRTIENIIAADTQGYFDYIVMEPCARKDKHLPKGYNNRSDKARFFGVMGDLEDSIRSSQVLDRGDFSIVHSHFIKLAISEHVNLLNNIYGPLGALYAEAVYMNQSNSCLPSINTEGVFEVENARPVDFVPNPKGTNLFYGSDSSRIILNGLHSGGKSQLLKTIALYHLMGLSGFPVPADSANIPVINSLVTSLDVKKYSGAGNLQSELLERARMLKKVSKGDLVVMDEFLQHASPDASSDLEPIILQDFYDTGASVVVVTHRGESLRDANKWRFYSPGYRITDERVEPTYSFEEGLPSEEILKLHAKQMLDTNFRSPVSSRRIEGQLSDVADHVERFFSEICELEQLVFGEVLQKRGVR